MVETRPTAMAESIVTRGPHSSSVWIASSRGDVKQGQDAMRGTVFRAHPCVGPSYALVHPCVDPSYASVHLCIVPSRIGLSVFDLPVMPIRRKD